MSARIDKLGRLVKDPTERETPTKECERILSGKKTRRFIMVLTVEEHARLTQLADEEGISKAELVRRLISA